jgi:hypothetical protein
MAWYKVDIRHGPGHQSRTTKYLYFDDEDWESVSEEDKKKEAFDMVVEYWWEYPIGNVTRIVELPEEIRQEKIEFFKDSRSEADKMIKELETIAPHKYYALLCDGGEKLQGVMRDDGIPNGAEKMVVEITKEQFDIFIEAEDDRQPTFSQLIKKRCEDCENDLGIDVRIKRGCYHECFVRPNKVLF